MNLPDIISFGGALLIIAILAVVALGIFALVGVAVLNVFGILDSHQKRKYLCCPPGLGCNSPENMEPCHRRQARKVGSIDEVITLDGTWSEANAAPPWRPLYRTRRINRYDSARDMIMVEAMRRTAEEIGHKPGRLALQGEVMPNPGNDQSGW